VYPVAHCLLGLAPWTRRIFVFSYEPMDYVLQKFLLNKKNSIEPFPAAIINGVTLYLVPVQSIKSI
jgi:hypothetical protein